MAVCPFARWRPLPENWTQDTIDPDQAILHTAVDARGRTSLFGYFGQEKITLESTFYIYMDGDIEQYLDTTVQADANRWANPRAISIETEDDGTPDTTPWSPAQVRSLIRLLDWICDVHPKVRRRRCPAWDEAGIGYHTMWGAPSPWTPTAGKTCPGKARIPQVDNIIRTVREAGSPAPAPAQESLFMSLEPLEEQEILSAARRSKPSVVRREGSTGMSTVSVIWGNVGDGAGYRVPLGTQAAADAWKFVTGQGMARSVPSVFFDSLAVLPT
jgi:hypothetical protein